MADAQLGDTKLFDLTSTMTFADPRLETSARGRVEHLTTETMNVGAGTALDLNGAVDGSFAIEDVHAPFSFTAMRANGHASLTASTIAGLAIDQAEIDGSLGEGALTIRRAVATGSGVKADAGGTVVFGETGSSALDVTVDADDLAAIGTWSGQPIAGAGHIEAHVTGPHNEPDVTGRYSLRQIADGADVSALTLNGDLHASIPEWRLADAKFSTRSEGTFLKVKSLEITRVTGQASYANEQIDLDADLADAQRELRIAGHLALSSPNRALSVKTLSLTTAGETWTLPAGTTAVVRADSTKVEVNGLTLTKDAERVTADGVFALTSDAASSAAGLRIRVDQVQLADANRVLLGTRRLRGLLNGDVTIAGPVADLRVSGEIAVTDGAVEQTPFESLRAKVTLENHDLALDAMLVQSAANQVKAAGHVPVGAGSLSSPRAMDVAITSTQIDLGLAQLFTSSVTNLAGTGALNLKLTGSPQAPIVDGTVTIANGAFAIVGGGVDYSKVMAALTFNANHLAIETLEVHDNDDHVLRAFGGLDVLGDSEKRAFDVNLHADAFHVLKNEMGTLQLNADVQVTGDLGAPVVRGQVRLESGRLQVDQILERTTKSAYSTTPGAPLAVEPVADTPLVSAQPPGTPETAPVKPPQQSLFDRVDLDMSMRLPDNLVMRGRGLRTAGSSVGLGDMNVIAGGTLRIRKPAGGPLDVLGNIELIRGDVHVSRPALRRAARERSPFQGHRAVQSGARRRCRAGRLRRRGDRARDGHGETSAVDPHEPTAARPGRDPVAHRVRPALGRPQAESAPVARRTSRRDGRGCDHDAAWRFDRTRPRSRPLRDPAAKRRRAAPGRVGRQPDRLARICRRQARGGRRQLRRDLRVPVREIPPAGHIVRAGRAASAHARTKRGRRDRPAVRLSLLTAEEVTHVAPIP